MQLASASNAELIAHLDSHDMAIREAVARELYRRGREAAQKAIAPWRANPEIAALITNHATVGIALAPERFARLRELLGNPRLADVPPDQDAEEFEWSVGADAHLDILTTRAPGGDGAIAKFLAKFGEGIQQVEFLAGDIDRVTVLLRSRLNVSAIYPVTRAGADGTRVNFFLAGLAPSGKILIELVQANR